MTGDGWLLYGATGYTGELIAQEAVDRGLRPILAGRNAEALRPLADRFGLPWRAFGLDDPHRLTTGLAGVRLVLHCAGPFAETAAPMLNACRSAGADYLDITGEIDVFAYIFEMHDQAVRSGVVLCPGVGFDVIPTDCVAASLVAAMPDATHLALGFDSRGQPSRGTARTSVASMTVGRVRRDGRLVGVRAGALVRTIDFGAGEKTAVAIGWGDVYTAYHTTGIENIEVYLATSPRRARQLRLASLAGPVLRVGAVRRAAARRVEAMPAGPSPSLRARTPAYVWGEVRNAAGQVRTARITTANPYTLTAYGAIQAVVELLDRRPDPGVYTPSRLFGADLVTRLPGSGPLVLT